MSSPNFAGDPRAGRNHHLPSRNRTFKDGEVDPVIATKRPLFTVGNAVLLVIGVGFGMYATGNLPQLDTFFDHLDAVGKANNNAVVSTMITYGSVIVGVVVLGIFGLMMFAFVNAYRRRASDPKGWRKAAKAGPQPRKVDRQTADLPSLILPLTKARPQDALANAPATPVDTTARPLPSPTPIAGVAVSTQPAPVAKIEPQTPAAATPPAAQAIKPTAAKLAAMEAAAKAQAAADAKSDDKPSFVMPYGKIRKPKADLKTPS
jgi:hypothetical protein